MGNLQKLQETVKRENWVILDTETTGLKNAEIVEIAIIDNLGETLLNTLVLPALPIPSQATAIHGITNEMVVDAPTWFYVGDVVQETIQGKDVLVYNAKFDRHMCYSSDEYSGIERIPWRDIGAWFCVMEAFAEYYGEYNPRYGSYTWKPLKFAAECCNYVAPTEHRAWTDCITTLAVVNFLAKVEIKP